MPCSIGIVYMLWFCQDIQSLDEKDDPAEMVQALEKICDSK